MFKVFDKVFKVFLKVLGFVLGLFKVFNRVFNVFNKIVEVNVNPKTPLLNNQEQHIHIYTIYLS